MITAHSRSNPHSRSTRKLGRAALIADGCFLALVGGVQMSFELLSHFFGGGPLGRIFAGSPYTIGFFEAHGLALLIGLLLILAALASPTRVWHGFAACVHVLLGGANLLFWSSFAVWGLVPMGIVATVFHGLFLIAQLFCFVRTSTRDG